MTGGRVPGVAGTCAARCSAWVIPDVSKLRKWYAPTRSPVSWARAQFAGNRGSTCDEPSVALIHAKSMPSLARVAQSISPW
jgi:hypothetical protein